MSVDVQYLSFSPSRANDKWANFKDDFLALKNYNEPKFITPEEKEIAEQERVREIRSKIAVEFENKRKHKAQQIFEYFKAKGYFIPGTTWDDNLGSDEFGNTFVADDPIKAKMDYLNELSGPVYPQGFGKQDQNSPFLLLKDCPLSKNYSNLGWAAESEALSIALANKWGNLNENQNELLLNCQNEIEYLVKKKITKQKLIHSLANIDLHFGSVYYRFDEDNKVESKLLEELVDFANLENEDGIPHKKEWIRLYSMLDSNFIRAAGEAINSNGEYETNEIEILLTDYLQEIKPVIKNLKEGSDTVFVRDYMNGYPFEPIHAQQLLTTRALKFVEQFKDILPSIKEG